MCSRDLIAPTSLKISNMRVKKERIVANEAIVESVACIAQVALVLR
jgi:hypothetical protein